METVADGGHPSTNADRLVFLLDVDNTLLDNDALKAEIGKRVEALVGTQLALRFWVLYEEVRQEQDYVDYPETLARFIHEHGAAAKPEQLRAIFESLPFASFLYPGVMETLQHLRSLGTAVILSDGDQVFQPRKIRQSGLEEAVGGNVLIYVHKEHELAHVFARYPADHYVVVDDKSRILSALEEDCPTAFTTVFVLQGHYAREGEYRPTPDITIHHIAELSSFSKTQFLQGATDRAATR
jgi:FMN phosphatase YigB (HAD superfamily)